MPNQSDHQLIDYLDGNLNEQERREVEELIHTNHKAYEQWSYLKLSVAAIEHAALNKQVAAVREQYYSQRQSRTKNGNITRFRFMLSAAAVLVLALGLAVFKYASTTALTMYKDNYSPYNLSIQRSVNGVSDLDQAYLSKNWTAVITSFNNTPEKDNKGLFLMAMAQMELKQFAEAAKNFEQLQMNNAQTGDDYFQEEAEYYLAMSYLAMGSNKQAIELLKKIRSNEAHVFYTAANRISDLDLKILESKTGR